MKRNLEIADNMHSIDSLEEIRSQIVDRLLLYYAFIVPCTWVAAIWRSMSVGWQPIFSLQLLISIPFFVVAIYRKRLGFPVRVTTLLIPLYLLGLVGTYCLGLTGSGLLILFASSVFTAVFFGIRAGVITSLLNVVAVIVFGVAFASDVINLDFDISAHARSGVAWATKAVVFLLFAPMVVIAIAVVQNQLASSLKKLKESYALLVSRQQELTEAHRIARMGRWEVDLAAHKLSWSDEVYRFFGKHKGSFTVNHESFLECVFPPDREKVHRAIADSAKDHLPFEIGYRVMVDDKLVSISQRGQTICDNQNTVVRVVGTIQDITERMNIESQLQSRQKMEAIGQLAGGIAHDFNNIISGIMGACDLLGLRVSQDANAKSILSVILQSGEKAASLTEKLLTFARQSPQTDELVDLHRTVEDSIFLLKSFMGGQIGIELSLSAENRCVMGDASLLQSVLLNLGINAAQAMPDGGTLTIETRNIQLDNQFCRSSSFSLSPGDYLQIEVRDTGTGIPLDVLPHIFEPFYTTKGEEKGTGLGLATTYGTIKRHGGSIDVKSVQDQGAVFKILLPLSGDQPSTTAQRRDGIAEAGTILLVDDEPNVRSNGTLILEHLGYQVKTAADGRRALDLLAHEKERIDLVILDMIMPEMNGRECFWAIKQKYPSIRIVVSSGYAKQEDLQDLLDSGLRGFVPKPFRTVTLSQIVNKALQS